MLVNVKLDVSWYYLSRLQTLLLFLILNATAKNELTILVFLYCDTSNHEKLY